jgi:Peptidase family M28
MKENRLRWARAFLSVAILLLFFAPSVVLQTPDSVLVKIEKGTGTRISAWMLADVRAVQELDTCWIAESSLQAVSRLRRRGVACEVLDQSPEDKAYFLVRVPEIGDVDTLRQLGTVWPIEGDLCLFYSGGENLRELLPPSYVIKRLSGPIPVPVTLGPPVTGRAVLRWPPVSAQREQTDVVSEMVGQVSRERLSAHISDLQLYQTRYASTSNCEESGNYILDFFRGLGLEAESDRFTVASRFTTSNIVATLPGRTAPDQVVIVCAHYDSTSDQRLTEAPGADDDGSGTAAVMEIARVLAGYPFDFTVRFICFSAEEWGLYGSKFYAEDAKRRGERIVGVINMDMVAYTDREPEDLDVVANPASEWLADRYIASVRTYVPLEMLKVVSSSMTGSDHSPFWDQGYSALCLIEDAPLRNPNYHKVTDLLDTLNMDFAVSVTRASLAVTADLAQPYRALQPPTALTARQLINRSLFSRAKTVYIQWTPGSGRAAGYNVYRTTTPGQLYRRINSALVSASSYVDRLLDPRIAYCYVVTAVDEQGNESNYSQEVSDGTTWRW